MKTVLSMCEAKRYPIGVQSFEKIIKGNFLYVDKTEYIYMSLSKAACTTF